MPLLEVMQKKLREAHYFLQQMETDPERQIGNPEDFEFLLSALLSASRSITDALENRRYRTWFDSWRNNRVGREQELLKFMCDQRNAEVHRDGADVEVTVQFVPITQIRYGGRGHPTYYGFHWWGPPGSSPPALGMNVHHFKLGGTPVEALSTCRDFVTLLDELIAAFEKAHPTA